MTIITTNLDKIMKKTVELTELKNVAGGRRRYSPKYSRATRLGISANRYSSAMHGLNRGISRVSRNIG